MKQRLLYLHSKLDELNLDALLISNVSNVTYLTNFKADDCYILLDGSKRYFLADFRNIEEAKRALKNFEVVRIKDSIFKTVPELIRKRKVKRLGFETKSLDYASYAKLKKDLKKSCKLIPTFDLIEELRQIKDSSEIKLIKKAVDISISAYKFAKKIVRSDISENKLISRIECFIKSKGGQGTSFEPIAASGKHSAYPHAKTTNKKIGKNTALTLDLGVIYKGYRSDLTRVFFLGRIPADLKKIYDIVLQAQEKAISKIKPGISAAQIDAQARNFIAQKGFGHYFQHSLGHGIGLDVHEAPFISVKNKKPLVAGMVFTIEPGIYIPGKFGVRIEDIVLVKKNGVEVLSGALDKSA